MSKIDARRALAQVFTSNLLLSLAGVVSGFVLARTLGPAGRGEVASIQALPTLLTGLTMLGMHEAIVYCAIETPGRARGLLATATRIGFVASMCAALVIAAIYLIIGKPWAAVVYLSFMPLSALMLVPQYSMQASGRFATFSLMRGITTVLWTSLAVLTLIAGPTRNPAFVTIGYLVGVAALVPLYMAWGFRAAPGHGDAQPGDSRRLLRFGLPVTLTAVPSALNLRLDVVIVASAFHRTEAGLYVAAVAWGAAVTPSFAAIATVGMPIVKQRLSDGEADVSRRILMGTGALLVAVSLVAVPASTLLFTRLFGVEYRTGLHLAMVALLASSVQGSKDVLSAVIRAHGRVKVPLVAEITGVTIMVGGLWPAFHYWGLMGGQIVSIASYACTIGAMAIGWRVSAARPVATDESGGAAVPDSFPERS